MPMSLGIQAITIPRVGKGDRGHSLDEWIDVAKPESVRGMTVGLAALAPAALADPAGPEVWDAENAAKVGSGLTR